MYCITLEVCALLSLKCMQQCVEFRILVQFVKCHAWHMSQATVPDVVLLLWYQMRLQCDHFTRAEAKTPCLTCVRLLHVLGNGPVSMLPPPSNPLNCSKFNSSDWNNLGPRPVHGPKAAVLWQRAYHIFSTSVAEKAFPVMLKYMMQRKQADQLMRRQVNIGLHSQAFERKDKTSINLL